MVSTLLQNIRKIASHIPHGAIDPVMLAVRDLLTVAPIDAVLTGYTLLKVHGKNSQLFINIFANSTSQVTMSAWTPSLSTLSFSRFWTTFPIFPKPIFLPLRFYHSCSKCIQTQKWIHCICHLVICWVLGWTVTGTHLSTNIIIIHMCEMAFHITEGTNIIQVISCCSPEFLCWRPQETPRPKADNRTSLAAHNWTPRSSCLVPSYESRIDATAATAMLQLPRLPFLVWTPTLRVRLFRGYASTAICHESFVELFWSPLAISSLIARIFRCRCANTSLIRFPSSTIVFIFFLSSCIVFSISSTWSFIVLIVSDAAMNLL